MSRYDAQRTTKTQVLNVKQQYAKTQPPWKKHQKNQITDFNNTPLDARAYHCSALIAETRLADGQ